MTGYEAVVAISSLACDVLCADETWIGQVRTLAAAAGTAALVNARGSALTIVSGGSSGGAVAEAKGFAHLGKQACALVDRGCLGLILPEIAAAAQQRLPVVVIAGSPLGTSGTADGAAASLGAALWSATGLGIFVTCPVNVEDSVDQALLAHRAAASAQMPAVVLLDGLASPDCAQDVAFPAREVIAEYLARALATPPEDQPGAATVVSETPSALLRGEGKLPGELAAAAAGRCFAAGELLAELLRRAADELGHGVGRPAGPLAQTGEAMDATQLILLASGREIASAALAAMGPDGRAVAATGIRWISPFPLASLLQVVRDASAVALIDWLDASGTNPGLIAALLDSVPMPEGRAHDVVPALVPGGPTTLTRGALEALVARIASGELPGRPVVLTPAPSPAASAFPKRRAQVDAFARRFPGKTARLLSRDGPYRSSAESTAVGVLGPRQWLGGPAISNALAGLASSGNKVRVSFFPAGGESCLMLVSSGIRALPPTPWETELRAIVLLSRDLDEACEPLAPVADQGLVIIVTKLDTDALWGLLPASWRTAFAERRLRLTLVRGEATAALSKVGQLVAGTAIEDPSWEPVDVRLLAQRNGEHGHAGAREEAPMLPPCEAPAEDLVRYWGELVQPRRAGERLGAADPLLSSPLVPASTAALRGAHAWRESLPELLPDRCTGCGACLVACPDSAITARPVATQALLESQIDAAAADHPVPATAGASGKLKRAVPAACARLAKAVRGEGRTALSAMAARAALTENLARLHPSAAEQDYLEGVLDSFERGWPESMICAAPAAVASVPAAVFVWAVDPDACQGCGLCVEACADGALVTRPRSVDAIATAGARLRGARALACEDAAIATFVATKLTTPLAALQMSATEPHPFTGGGLPAPGSGTRLAMNLALSVADRAARDRAAARLMAMQTASQALRECIQNSLAASIDISDMRSLEQAMAGSGGGSHATLATIIESLEQSGAARTVDGKSLKGLARAAQSLEKRLLRLGSAAASARRTGYAIVLAGADLERRLLAFPYNPFAASALVSSGGGGEALGVVRGLLDGWLADLGLLAEANAMVGGGYRAESRFRGGAPAWRDLTQEQRSGAPFVLLGIDAARWRSGGFAAVASALASDLPVKVLMFDDALGEDSPCPTAVALAASFHNVLVAATSLADPAHFHRCLAAALAHSGPALVSVLSPEPDGHGFSPSQTLARARDAVRARVSPVALIRPATSVGQQRLDLSGNPSPEMSWEETECDETFTPVHWALGDSRWERFLAAAPERARGDDAARMPLAAWLDLDAAERPMHQPTFIDSSGKIRDVPPDLARFAGHCGEQWRALRDKLRAAPIDVETVRNEVVAALREQHQRHVEALKQEFEQTMAQEKEALREQHLAQVRERLLQISGLAAGADREKQP